MKFVIPMATIALLCASIADARFVGGNQSRALSPEELKDRTAVGYFWDPANAKSGSFGTGFVIGDGQFVLTAAHNFVEAGTWQPEMMTKGKLDLSRALFHSDICQVSYGIESISVLTFDPGREPARDVGIVKVTKPLCAKASPMKIEAVSELQISNLQKQDSVSITAYWPISRLQISYGQLWETMSRKAGYMLVQHTIDSTPGNSGAPVVANSRPTVAIGIHSGGYNSSGNTFNAAVVITPTVIDDINAVLASPPKKECRPSVMRTACN